MDTYNIIRKHLLKNAGYPALKQAEVTRLEKRAKSLADTYSDLDTLLDIPEIRKLLIARLTEMGDF